ncbi:MAG: hypothetical protein QOC67_2873 [Pseudonocardiales bacterium]|nr:hypothetical protein [Pseudonocardiales bacterium]
MPPRQRASADRVTVGDLVDAVAQLIDSGGVEAVTMRGLARQCGVGVTTLYGYVRTKDELLGLYADRLLGEIDVPDAAHLRWDEQIAAIFRAVYRVLVEHPELALIVGTQPVPGAAAQRLFQQVLRALAEIGLDDRQIRTAYEVLAAYTTGFVQQQAARQARVPGLADLLAGVRAGDQEAHPVGGPGGDGSVDQEAAFGAGLAVVLAGLSVQSGVSG